MAGDRSSPGSWRIMNSNPVPTAPMRLQLTEPSVVPAEASPGVIRLLTERLELVEAMPRTPSGKIQKFKLRELAEKFGGAGK